MIKDTFTGSESTGSEIRLRALVRPLAAIVLGMMMVMLDSTAINVAIPKLIHDLGAPFTTLQWTITGYTLAMSATIPLAGWISDRLGARKAFLITIVLFTLGSLLCSFAQTAEQLIVFRVIQGLAGGMINPIGMAMVFRLAPEGKRGQIMGLLGIPMLLAPASGPILSGWMVEFATWEWIFLINLPIGTLALVFGIKFLPVTKRKETLTLDVIGMIVGPLSFVLITLGVTRLGDGLESGGGVTIIAGVILLICFVINELRHNHPLLELRAFSSPNFTKGIVVSWIQYIALNGSLVLIPQYLQLFKGFSPFTTGLVMSVLAITSGLLMPIGGRIYDFIGIRPLAFSGLSIIAGALITLSNLSIETSLTIVVCAIAGLGIGMGLCMMSLNTFILQSAPPLLISRVTPLTSAASQIIISFAITGLTGFLNYRSNVHSPNINRENLFDALAYGDTFVLAACIAAAGAMLSLFIKRKKERTVVISNSD
ncbi:DHA2 family efflux MFS transporter permease subunit [Paenibacillus anaericanus]|uniref:DHA2 family efflux MFS transporter permease subunit n=1 Tax=Paenibacillus anaericanus TaxID=170367 RepID=A0A3S1DA19_9BACL|nr:MDR family MFS transporter [Paenibacillus anaericanus]RUT40316.1 DHA2 family efflux MFS transporter permease subunit [Paenibacillus anaericanus]